MGLLSAGVSTPEVVGLDHISSRPCPDGRLSVRACVRGWVGGLGDDEVMTGDLVSDPYRRSTKSCRGNGLPTTLDLHDRLIRWGWVMMHALVHIRLVSTKIIQTICNQRQGHIVKIFHPALLCTWQHHLHLRTDHKVSLFFPSLLTLVLLHSPLIDIFQKLKCL